MPRTRKAPVTSYSGGEIRMGGGELYQGTPVGYRMLVALTTNHRCGVEACAETMEPLLLLLQQFENLGYEFVRLERIFGN